MRLRIAPSPTGMVHVGTIRAGLFNWLYAKRHGGVFVLRIEDTDIARNKTEWTEGILDAFRWLGMDWDEGPYYQTANKSLHEEAAERLFRSDKAYYCECTRDQLVARTGNQDKGYDGFCRDRGLGPGDGRALRFRVPQGSIVVNDLVRGTVTFDNSSIEDFVIRRSNGGALFLLANVIDDMDQHISHVVRGEDHLPNTPKQVMLWEALGNDPVPTYAHLPLLVNEQGKKLSKRRDKVAVEEFRAEGYLPEALRNYLALLGWSPKGDREILDVHEMIREFDLSDVQPSPARFDMKKLAHFNGEYIRGLPVNEFTAHAGAFIGNKRAYSEQFNAVAPLVQSRVALLGEVNPMVEFLFIDAIEPDAALVAALDAIALAVLDDAIKEYESLEWTTDALHGATLAIGERHGLKLGKAQAPIRLAVTGKKVGPPLFESLEVLGRERTLVRLRNLQDATKGP